MSDQPTTPPELDENQIIAERRAKLQALRAKGIAFPNQFQRDNLAGDLLEDYEDRDRDSLDLNPVVVKVAGRMMLKRVMGKASFATLQDGSGRIQIYVSNDITGEAVHDAFKHWDLGDIVGVSGMIFQTNKGELTVQGLGTLSGALAVTALYHKVDGIDTTDVRIGLSNVQGQLNAGGLQAGLSNGGGAVLLRSQVGIGSSYAVQAEGNLSFSAGSAVSITSSPRRRKGFHISRLCVVLATRLPCVSTAPLATPVVPPVYCKAAMLSWVRACA